ncbi:MAG: hypothetical protein FWE31_00925 [Firmicutes bacterium]|nr:hypothetical protein [Bacillota bacterium]
MDFVKKIWGSIWVMIAYIVLVGLALGVFLHLIISDGRVLHMLYCWLVIALIQLPTILRLVFKLRLPAYLHIYYMFIVSAHWVLGNSLGLFNLLQPYGYDKFLHTLSGAILTCVAIHVAVKQKLKFWIIILFAFSASMMIAAMWEIVEFIADYFTGSNMMRWQDRPSTEYFMGSGLIDTMVDMLVHLLGTTIVIVSYTIYRWRKNGWQIRPAPAISPELDSSEENFEDESSGL